MIRFVLIISTLLAFMACSSTSNLSKHGNEPNFSETGAAVLANDIESGEPKEHKRNVTLNKTSACSLYANQGGILKSGLIKKQVATAEKMVVKSTDKKLKNRSYTLQFEVVSDVDEAQKRRWAVSSKTGLGAYILFDSPFYKIRGGKWSNKGEAEDASLQFNAMGIAAILIEL